MIRVLIADDHQLVTDGLKLMLEGASDMQCVATAANGAEALQQLVLFPADVLLLDINMPEMDGITCCRKVKERFPDVKILILSMLRESSLVKMLLKEGASGFLLKNAGKEEVLDAIRRVMAGKQAFSTEVLDDLLHSFSAKPDKSAAKPPMMKISRREKDILRLIVEERTTSEIASELFISFGTVETHRRNLLMKLNARNTAGLVKAALEYDLLK